MLKAEEKKVASAIPVFYKDIQENKEEAERKKRMLCILKRGPQINI